MRIVYMGLGPMDCLIVTPVFLLSATMVCLTLPSGYASVKWTSVAAGMLLSGGLLILMLGMQFVRCLWKGAVLRKSVSVFVPGGGYDAGGDLDVL